MREIPTGVEPGQPVVVISGGVGVSAQVWDAFRAGLRGRTFEGKPINTVVVERPGNSWIESWELGDVPTLESETARIEGVLTDLREVGAGPIVLVAHSAAGFFAELVFMRSPELLDAALLVDISSTITAFPAWPGLIRSSHAVGKVTGNAEMESMLLENATFRYWARDLQDLRKIFREKPTSTIPVTLVLALNGKAFSADFAWRRVHRHTARRWRTIGVDLHERIVEPCGHMVMEERPDVLVEEVAKLLAEA